MTFRKAVAAYRHLVVRQRLAVVDLLIVGGGQLHVALGDFELAVFDHERHLREVVVLILEVRRLQLHVVRARVGALHFRFAVELEVVFRVQRVADRLHRIALHGLLGSVILLGSRVLLDRYNHFVRGRRDFQRAGREFDVVVLRVRALVQRVGERVLALANVRLRARHLVRRAFFSNKALAANRHRVVRQRIAVVDLLIVGGGQRHIALADRQRSVFDYERHLREARIRVLEVRSLQLHVVGARVSALHFRLASKLEVVFRVQLVADRLHRIARHGLLGSVILRGSRVLLDLHCHRVRNLRDFQRSFDRGDLVVARLRAVFQLVGERVLALANVRLRARHLVRRAFFSNKALAANRHRVVRQRIAVVDLLIRSGGQRHVALADRQTTVGHNKLNVREVLARVRELALVQPHRIGLRISALHFRIAAKREVICRVQRVAGNHAVAARGLLGSVILRGNLVALDRYRHLVRGRRDRQFSRIRLRNDIFLRIV